LLVALALMIIPFVILGFLIKLLPPWHKEELAGG
jgi:hypothetical protein